MKEKILLAPGLNGIELMKSLALHGVNCIGLRICGVVELARLALMRSGISITGEFVSAKEESAIIADAANGESYFGNLSYSDIRDISAAIRRMRTLIADEDEAQGMQDKLRSMAPRYHSEHPRIHQNGSMPGLAFKIFAYTAIIVLLALLVYIIVAGSSIEMPM